MPQNNANGIPYAESIHLVVASWCALGRRGATDLIAWIGQRAVDVEHHEDDIVGRSGGPAGGHRGNVLRSGAEDIVTSGAPGEE